MTTGSRQGGLTWQGSGAGGYAPDVLADPRCMWARKRELPVQVRFTAHDRIVDTREGPVQARAGDAIVTGAFGEHWPVRRARFADKYREIAPGRFVSLPLKVLAIAMDAPFAVLLADGGTTLNGKAGDYLVDYGDGTLGIVAAAIFAATYDVETN